MTDFIPFTETRKKQIDHLRERVINERPERHVSTFCGTEYVTVTRPLSLIDYVVYAALRGADYRKGDHTGGKVATEALKMLIDCYRKYRGWPSKLLHKDSGDEEREEFFQILEEELAKWKDAPALEHPQYTPAEPIGNFFDLLKGEVK